MMIQYFKSWQKNNNEQWFIQSSFLKTQNLRMQ